MNLDSLTPEMKCLLFVFGGLHWMRTRNLLSGGTDAMTPLGVSNFDQLEATGYRPTKDEVLDLLQFFAASDKPLIDSKDEEHAALVLSHQWDRLKKAVELEDAQGDSL